MEDEFSSPTAAELRELREVAGEHMTDENLLRHWKARRGVLRRAKRDISDTIEWKKTIPKHTYKHCQHQLETMSAYINGCDSEGNCTIYMVASRDPPGTAEQKIASILFNIEEAITIMEQNKQKGIFNARQINYIVDLKGFTLSNSRRDVTVSKQWGAILMKYYPTILRKVYLINYPMAFKLFWSLCKSFVNEKEQASIKWVPSHADLRQYFCKEGFNPEWLETQMGGDLKTATYINSPSNVLSYKPFFDQQSNSDDLNSVTCLSYVDCESISFEEDEEEEDEKLDSQNSSTTDDSQTCRHYLEASHSKLMTGETTVCIRSPAGQLLEHSISNNTTVNDIIQSNVPVGRKPSAFVLTHESVHVSTDANLVSVIQSKNSSVVFDVTPKKTETCCIVM